TLPAGYYYPEYTNKNVDALILWTQSSEDPTTEAANGGISYTFSFYHGSSKDTDKYGVLAFSLPYQNGTGAVRPEQVAYARCRRVFNYGLQGSYPALTFKYDDNGLPTTSK
ncbi:hypothetical protein, partial [Bacteroides sp. 519]|uniref:hypothetical protein n=1 Tax=Bacteroides sp. 519 TaxID=2302937 RepID=UPI0013D3B54D